MTDHELPSRIPDIDRSPELGEFAEHAPTISPYELLGEVEPVVSRTTRLASWFMEKKGSLVERIDERKNDDSIAPDKLVSLNRLELVDKLSLDEARKQLAIVLSDLKDVRFNANTLDPTVISQSYMADSKVPYAPSKYKEKLQKEISDKRKAKEQLIKIENRVLSDPQKEVIRSINETRKAQEKDPMEGLEAILHIAKTEAAEKIRQRILKHEFTPEELEVIRKENEARRKEGGPPLGKNAEQSLIAKRTPEKIEDSMIEFELEVMLDSEIRTHEQDLLHEIDVAKRKEQKEKGQEQTGLTIYEKLDIIVKNRAADKALVDSQQGRERRTQTRLAWKASVFDLELFKEATFRESFDRDSLERLNRDISVITYDDQGNELTFKDRTLASTSLSQSDKRTRLKAYHKFNKARKKMEHTYKHIRRTWADPEYDGGINPHTRKLIALRNGLQKRIDELTPKPEASLAEREAPERVEGPEKTEGPVVDILEKYLSYRDVKGEETERADKYNKNAVIYARELVRLNSKDGGVSVKKAANDIRTRFESLRSLMPGYVQLSEFADSKSWIYWDIGRQEVLKEINYPSTIEKGVDYSGSVIIGPDSSKDDIARAELMRSVVAQRRLGWELHRKALNGETLSWLDPILDEQTKDLLYKVGDDNHKGQLSSSEYAYLGKKIEMALRHKSESSKASTDEKVKK